MKYITASRAGYVSCHACGRVEPRIRSVTTQHCGRCGAVLHRRNPDSLTRTWALLIAAALLYIPANLLPVMHTASLIGSEDDTIMSGVVYFWTSGDWPLAVIVFIASILVPMLKLSVLGLLTITAQRRSRWRPLQRTKLYRIVEKIGRWSMLDVFVVTLTVALVRFNSLAVITAGPGAIAFGSVVILTMLASMQFDPRLIWDNVRTSFDEPEEAHAESTGNEAEAHPEAADADATDAAQTAHAPDAPDAPPHSHDNSATGDAARNARRSTPNSQDPDHD